MTKEIVTKIAVNPKKGNKNDYLVDYLLYKVRYAIDRPNAWLDAFKALLVSFQTNKIY